MPNLVGIGLSQVPTNSMLGGMAYQDPEHASIKNLDLKNLSQINSEIADTAVDIFVYDTRKDSDGGAWRKRTQNTSWYKETLGTKDRGTRKEFPAIAVIVSDTISDTVTIYDGDDPDLSMWMVFEVTTGGQGQNIVLNRFMSALRNVSMLNGNLFICSSSTSSADRGGGVWINFISEFIYAFGTNDQQSENIYGTVSHNIAQRNTVLGTNAYADKVIKYQLVNNAKLNDVAMTVLPNAPIDPSTGLPVPTIAIATNTGMSVIKDNGNIVDTTSSHSSYTYCRSVEWASNGDLLFVLGDSNGFLDYLHTYDGFNSGDNVISIDTNNGSSQNARSAFRHAVSSNAYASHMFDAFTVRGSDGAPNYAQLHPVAKKDPFEYGVRSPQGLTHISENIDSKGSLVAYTNTTHSTGWMHGDIKGAFLSDTDTTNVTGTNLITNGTFDSNVNNWVENTSTNTYSSGKMQITRSGGSGATSYQAFTTVVGTKYVATAEVNSSGSRGNFYVKDGTGWSGTTLGTAAGVNGQTLILSTTFIATSTTSSVAFSVDTNNTSIIVDNVSVRLADSDRSVNNNGLQVFGTVTKSAVATGAELVAYSGFSNSNYLRQPHNADLEIGTGEISISAWFKSSTSDTSNYKGLIYLNGRATLGPGIQVMSGPTNGIYLYVYGASGTQNFGGNYHFGYNDGNWHHLLVSTKPGQQQIYVDGILKETGVVDTGSMTNSASELYVGRWYGNANTSNYWWRGDIALVRVSRSIPTAEQIKKMYNDEKHLFQENAKCTLYGSSEAVTAIAHDDSTDTLHVGTSSGRSEFQGLCRINNTTEAVTTAISASNGLVAEQ